VLFETALYRGVVDMHHLQQPPLERCRIIFRIRMHTLIGRIIEPDICVYVDFLAD